MTLSGATQDLHAIWNQWFPVTPPFGFLLRDAFAARWMRIHSLPESQRYPESGFEYAEIQRRHHAVAEVMLGADPCLMLVGHPCTGRYGRDVGAAAGFTDTQLPRLWALDAVWHDDDSGAFAGPMCVSGCLTTWDRTRFARFIAAVAEDKMRGLLLNCRSGAVYAPYDGGADLIFDSSLARDLAREQFSSWLSSHPEGL